MDSYISIPPRRGLFHCHRLTMKRLHFSTILGIHTIIRIAFECSGKSEGNGQKNRLTNHLNKRREKRLKGMKIEAKTTGIRSHSITFILGPSQSCLPIVSIGVDGQLERDHWN